MDGRTDKTMKMYIRTVIRIIIFKFNKISRLDQHLKLARVLFLYHQTRLPSVTTFEPVDAWYEQHATRRHITVVLFDLLQSMIPTWRSRELLTWVCHEPHLMWFPW